MESRRQRKSESSSRTAELFFCRGTLQPENYWSEPAPRDINLKCLQNPSVPRTCFLRCARKPELQKRTVFRCPRLSGISQAQGFAINEIAFYGFPVRANSRTPLERPYLAGSNSYR